MSEPKYPFPCFHTGRIVAEGTLDQLREYFNTMGMGEPFDAEGHLRYPQYQTSALQAQEAQASSQPALTLVKA